MRGTKLNRERGDSSKQLNPKTMTAAERGMAGRTKQSRRGTVKVEKAPPAFTEVERPPVTQVTPPKAGVTTDMSEGRSQVSADRGTGTGLSRTIGSARKKATEQGTEAKNFMSKSGKAKAAVTKEELDAFRKKPGNTELGYTAALRKYLNERDNLTPRKTKKMRGGGLAPTGGGIGAGIGGGPSLGRYKKGKKVEGYKKGGKIRGAGIAQRGVRPCKMR
tara:strand:- start:418 stop:1074 length:657 start_codon:yes stop_codon:yes gene_type:complete